MNDRLIRLYCVFTNVTSNQAGDFYHFSAIKGQGDSEIYKKDIYSIEFLFAAQKLETFIDISSINNQYFLLEIDYNTNLCISVIEELPSLPLLNKKLKDKVKNFNLNVLSNLGNLSLINNIPVPNDIYIDQELWDLLCFSLDAEEYPLLIGPKGCGKSSIGRALAKAKGYKFFAINCSDLNKPESFLYGMTGVENGTTKFKKAQFLEHFISDEKVIIYLQELSRITQQGANSLITVTENPSPFVYVKELSESFVKGPNVRFMADANFGVEYVGTNSLDGAFFDRFTAFMVDYLPEDEEIKLLQERTKNLDYDVAKSLVEMANQIRYKGEDLSIGVSTRKLLSLSKYLAAGFSMGTVVNKIFKNIFSNGASIESEELKTIFDSKI